METELDRIKSTMTISLGLKNRIRKLKGSMSYEQFLSKLIRDRNNLTHDENYIEIQNLNRKKEIIPSNNHKIIFSYNEYNNSENFIFDIVIEEIRKDGKKIETKKFKYAIHDALEASIRKTISRTNTEYRIYFALLEKAIQLEIEPMFRHIARIEDHYSWEKEFERLGLSKKAFEYDVMKKLRRLEDGVDYFD